MADNVILGTLRDYWKAVADWVNGTDAVSKPVVTVDSLSTLATQATQAEVLAKLSADPATQTTLAQILAKIITAPATEAKQDTLIAKDFATQTTLAGILAKLSADPATQTTLAQILAKLSADPATQTTLEAILTQLGTTGVKKIIDALPTGTNLLGKVGIDQTTPGVTNAVSVTGSSIADSGAIPIAQAQKDAIKYATDNILDIIGAENVKFWLPMNESSGSTAYDLLKKDLTFTIEGATLSQQGLFGNCMSFDGTNDRLIRTAATENTTGSTDQAIKAGEKLAVKLPTMSLAVGFVRLNLKRVGTLASATIKASLIANSGTTPTGSVAGAASTTLACSLIDTSYENRGFHFPTTPLCNKSVTYWLVLEYDNSTGVDDSNYICWAHDNGGGSYGQNRGVYSGGTWTISTGQSHVFSIWDNKLYLDGDYSLIFVSKDLESTNTDRVLTAVRSMTSTASVIAMGRSGYKYAKANDGTDRNVYNYALPYNANSIDIMTFSKTKDTAKVNNYSNGCLTQSTAGTAATGQTPMAHPFVIGATSQSAASSIFWKGLIGPVILIGKELTAVEVGKVTHQLMVLRKLGVSV